MYEKVCCGDARFTTRGKREAKSETPRFSPDKSFPSHFPTSKDVSHPFTRDPKKYFIGHTFIKRGHDPTEETEEQKLERRLSTVVILFPYTPTHMHID